MKSILIVLSLLLLGFAHVETLKNSFGHIKSFYKIMPRNKELCVGCYMFSKEAEKVYNINKKFYRVPYTSSSAFIVSHSSNKTILMTSGHVCEELNTFMTSEKFKALAVEVYSSIVLENESLDASLLRDNYYIKPEVAVYSFSGNEHIVDKIIAIDKENDICLLSTESKWGKKADFAEKNCVYEEIFNMSSSGGQFYPNSMPLRKGYINSIISAQKYDNTIYRDVNLYTLNVKEGASGSAVFNSNGKVCGSVNISYIKLDLSSGASRINLISFFEKHKNSL